ncbi:ABC transporter ATP-binding protein [Carnobacterium maltaromaticum]|uniref:ABC transporter ATP-binding protein n=1 Tax=Carnobacterium maltaromaticum TaxID=2751 RepID=UPI000C76A8A1|nr:ABC transporter ATP-binding protein [Carnobacterium maltaromaticum]PLS34662.1 ABC transporter ATP-binding protein [Carnobacterium maltaromaticum]PLS36480.1 ABC transporter ATP-binding protein [Carnobacterium maltaromaticum]PLS37295.1 ABC transporter ATP-binding protein [Carnobacterium maltaromaticum]PLS43511.1 ABC transporter ATP-binding protein [Carnobacterium maltaromaticum]PLS46838.1 ABC transporter ATP-binding protein [Carnobacterium maltaromaticum]
MKAIEINGLTKMYKDKAAVKNVYLEVNEGEMFGFIGPNGAGKSTTIKALLNFIYPTSGSAKILGLDSVKESKAIKKEVSYVSSDVRFYPTMTASEIIGYAAEFHQIKDAETKIKHYYNRFEIEPNKKLGDMSLGNKKKVSIVAGLIAEPKLMILDEPSSGLDPLMQHRLFEILTEKNKAGMTVFLSSHDLMEVQNYCSKAAFIKNGELIQIEDIDKDKADGKVVQLRGNNLNGTEFIKKGATIIESTTSSLQFIYNGDLQLILPLLVDSSITDVIIKNQDLEDKFMAMYEGGKKA